MMTEALLWCISWADIFFYFVQLFHGKIIALKIRVRWMIPNFLDKQKNFFLRHSMFSIIVYSLLNICYIVIFYILSCLPWRHCVWQASYILDNCFLHVFDMPFSHGVTVILLFQKWISVWYIYQRHLSMIINMESTINNPHYFLSLHPNTRLLYCQWNMTSPRNSN